MREVDLKILFGKAVREKRAVLGISQEELGDRAGLHRTYISDVERGARNVSLGSIDKLATALEISISTLFVYAADVPAPLPRERTTAELMEVLLVEDNPDDVELTLHAFRRARFANRIHVVRDGAEALEFLFQSGPHAERAALNRIGLVLLDLRLPKVSGIEVLRRIKTDERTQEIPVVILTVSDHDRDIAECRELGVDAYIVKPVGFRNFSEVTPRLSMHWALVNRPSKSAA
ncbi:MAG: hypothetical protein JWL59_196 [Chthoniobacteraceae bacterium]|nr:hypothetical protein [Chthoniobacteraceae bacterium]